MTFASSRRDRLSALIFRRETCDAKTRLFISRACNQFRITLRLCGFLFSGNVVTLNSSRSLPQRGLDDSPILETISLFLSLSLSRFFFLSRRCGWLHTVNITLCFDKSHFRLAFTDVTTRVVWQSDVASGGPYFAIRNASGGSFERNLQFQCSPRVRVCVQARAKVTSVGDFTFLRSFREADTSRDLFIVDLPAPEGAVQMDSRIFVHFI